MDALIPPLMYGTAWKELETERLTGLALRAGFRAIDTANQRKHYFEAGVGAALAAAYRDGVVAREGLFLQTKFTDIGGQDQRLPYDPRADLATQVKQSFQSSLEHLGTSYLDAYVLHGPVSASGVQDEDWRIWCAMERLAEQRKVRLLGLSNVDHRQLEEIWRGATVRPALVQNRCYARLGWDREVRAFCQQQGIVYQGFSLLTANPQILRHPEVIRLAEAKKTTPAQIVFAFTRTLGILPLSGTSNELHMREDLQAVELELSAAELRTLQQLQ